MIANLPVFVIASVVPFAIVNGPVTEALLLAAIVTLPVVAFRFTRNKLSRPEVFPMILPSLLIYYPAPSEILESSFASVTALF